MFKKTNNTEVMSKLGETAQMADQRSSIKRLGKAALALSALWSLLGIAVSPAIAADERNYEMIITVTDTREPPCEENYEIASWNPDLDAYLTSDIIDLFSPEAILQFEVYLNFSDGIDLGSCASPDIEPTGTVTAEFSVLDNELVATVNCNPPGYCDADQMSNEEFGGLIDGTIALKESSTPGEYFAIQDGTYAATLRVVWTP